MQTPPRKGMVVQHEIFGHGLITKIQPSESEIVVRFSETTYVTVTFYIGDFDSFLTIVNHDDAVTDPKDREIHSPDETNKRCLRELETKLALKAATKKPP